MMTLTQRPELLGRLCVIGAAIFFSSGGAAIKAATLSGWQIACLRAVVALVMLALFMPRHGGRRTGLAFAIGGVQGATMILFSLANTMTTAANAIFLQCTGQLYMPLLAPLLLRERVTRADLWMMAAVAAGMSLFFVGTEPPQATAPQPRLGDAIAIASGLTWALTVIGLRYAAREHGAGIDEKAAVLWGNGIAAALALPMALPLHDVSAGDVAVILYLGTFQVGAAYLLLARGMRAVPAFEASLLILLEPVLNPIWAYLVHGESPSHGALGGAAVIGSVTVVRALRSR
ncbi:MAG TPA: DMT family transporter [Candidatus Limnocylindrales bacterium]|nr:DMT family transporter [Candidatus Limnocylindrales bacterium]